MPSFPATSQVNKYTGLLPASACNKGRCKVEDDETEMLGVYLDLLRLVACEIGALTKNRQGVPCESEAPLYVGCQKSPSTLLPGWIWPGAFRRLVGP